PGGASPPRPESAPPGGAAVVPRRAARRAPRQRLSEPGHPGGAVPDAGQGRRRAAAADGARLAVAAVAAGARIDRQGAAGAPLPRDDQGGNAHECGDLRATQSVSQRATGRSITMDGNLRAARKRHGGRLYYRLHKPVELMTVVLTLLGHGCPLQAVVAAYG